MTRRHAFVRGGMAGGLLIVAADAVNWFITPAAHPDAGPVHFWLTVAQAVVGVVGAAWLAHTIPGEPAEDVRTPRAVVPVLAAARADAAGELSPGGDRATPIARELVASEADPVQWPAPKG